MNINNFWWIILVITMLSTLNNLDWMKRDQDVYGRYCNEIRTRAQKEITLFNVIALILVGIVVHNWAIFLRISFAVLLYLGICMYMLWIEEFKVNFFDDLLGLSALGFLIAFAGYVAVICVSC